MQLEARWSSRDPEARLGARDDPDSAESTPFALMAGGSTGLGVVAIRRVLARLRPEVVLELTASGINVGKARSLRAIPWSSIDRIVSDLDNPRAAVLPRVRIQLASGEVVPVPSQLYPEAETDFPTRAHLARATDVALTLTRAHALHNARDDDRP